jgi:hypothetical protein
MPKQIILDFDKEGEVKMETKGFTGTTCLSESEFMKKALGMPVGKPKMTKESKIGVANTVKDYSRLEH